MEWKISPGYGSWCITRVLSRWYIFFLPSYYWVSNTREKCEVFIKLIKFVTSGFTENALIHSGASLLGTACWKQCKLHNSPVSMKPAMFCFCWFRCVYYFRGCSLSWCWRVLKKILYMGTGQITTPVWNYLQPPNWPHCLFNTWTLDPS